MLSMEVYLAAIVMGDLNANSGVEYGVSRHVVGVRNDVVLWPLDYWRNNIPAPYA